MIKLDFNKPQELLNHLLSRGMRQGECLLWTGAKQIGGYGVQGVGKKVYRVHRIRYEIEHGKIPEGVSVYHHCENPSCFEITHLFAN